MHEKEINVLCCRETSVITFKIKTHAEKKKLTNLI